MDCGLLNRGGLSYSQVSNRDEIFAGEIARVHGGNPAAEVVLCRAVGRGRQPQSEEHKTCLLPHCARHHPCS